MGSKGGHIDRLFDGAGGEEVDQQFGSLDGHVCLCFFRARAEVGRAQHAGHAEERAIGTRFGRIDVEGDAGELAALEALDERFFVVDAAAGAVDQADSRLQQGDLLLANEVASLVVQRRVDGQVIDVGEHLLGGIAGLDSEVLGSLCREEGIVADDLHFQGEGARGHGLADASHADDSQGLAGQLGSHVELAIPTTLDKTLIGRVDVSRQGHHECNGLLGGGNRISARSVHHDDAEAGRGFFVDVVRTDASSRDRFEARVSFQHFRGDLDPASTDSPIELCEGILEVVAFQPGANFILDVSGRFEEVEAVLRKGIQYNHAGHGTSLLSEMEVRLGAETGRLQLFGGGDQ